MASKTTFQMQGGKERILLTSSYVIKRSADAIGQPVSDIQGGTCEISFSSNASNAELAAMINDAEKKFSASIKYQNDKDTSTMKELKLEEASIVRFREHIDTRPGVPPEEAMFTTLSITARKIEIGGASFENAWPKD